MCCLMSLAVMPSAGAGTLAVSGGGASVGAPAAAVLGKDLLWLLAKSRLAAAGSNSNQPRRGK